MRPFSLMEAIEASDSNGVSAFRSSFWELRPEKFVDLKGAALQKALALEIVSMQKQFVSNPRHMTAKLIERMAPTYSLDNEKEIVTVSYNVCPVLCLPGESPAAEIAELKQFFLTMKTYIQEIHDHVPEYMSSVGFVIETKCEQLIEPVKNESFPEYAAEFYEERAGQLSAMVEASPILTAWRNNFDKMLRKIGPWSWASLTEREFFDELDSPLFKKFHAQTLARNTSPKP